MEKQTIINAISSLSVVIDSLNRAGKNDEIDAIAKKVVELVKQL
jgi:hypothetical protein